MQLVLLSYSDDININLGNALRDTINPFLLSLVLSLSLALTHTQTHTLLQFVCACCNYRPRYYLGLFCFCSVIHYYLFIYYSARSAKTPGHNYPDICAPDF